MHMSVEWKCHLAERNGKTVYIDVLPDFTQQHDVDFI